MQVNGLATKGKVLDNTLRGKAVAAYRARLAVRPFHKVTFIQPEVYLANALLDIYHIKIICEDLREDTTQQLLAIHDAKITNPYEIMRMRGGACNWISRLTLDFGNFQFAKEFWSIGIESTESPFARLMAEGTGQIAFSRTGRTGDEKILPLMHKVKGGQTFHPVTLQPSVCGIVDLFKVGLVAKCRILGKPCYDGLGTVVPFPRKEHGKESVRRDITVLMTKT